MKTTEDLVKDYLIRQRWNKENYPNLNIENNENE